MSVSKEKKEELIKKHGKSSNDKGSTDVQVAILSHRISTLTEHLKINKKKQSTKRGLLKTIGTRKKLLSYFKKNSLEKYQSLIKSFGLSH